MSNNKMYDLVFEGGGAKGAAFVGAMQAFKTRGCTSRRLIGTSAGAITATLLAAGFTPDELHGAVQEKQGDVGQSIFSSFMDIPEDIFLQKSIDESEMLNMLNAVKADNFSFGLSTWIGKHLIEMLLKLPKYRQLFCFIEHGGLYAGEEFLSWIRQKLQSKGFDQNITLANFYGATNKKDLSLVASNISKYNMLVLNHRTAPDCPVALAVRMSMSIPFIWSEVVWKKAWGTYLKQDITGDRIVDGGMLSNFPLFLVEKHPEEHHDKAKIMGTDTKDEDAGTIGLLIDENLPVPEQKDTVQCSFSDNFKTVNRVNNLLNTMRLSHDNEVVAKNPQLICHLPAKGYGTTEFDMADYRLDALIKAGRTAMETYLDEQKVNA